MKANKIKAMVITITLLIGSTAGVWAYLVNSSPVTPLKGGSGNITEIKIRDDGRFNVKGKGLVLSSISLDNRANPVNFDLKLGRYSGKTEIQLDKKGRSRKGKDDDD